MKVYYGTNTDRVFVGEAGSAKECSKLINEFIQEKRLYEEPYRRYWVENNEVVIDYGSHINFFYIDNANAYLLSEQIH